MNRKLALAVLIIFGLLSSLVVSMQTVELAKANFIPYGTVTIISPANQTYNSNYLILNFSATFSATNTKTITYCIDGQPQITITGLQYNGDVLWETTNGTLTLPYLSNGTHLLEMYAKTNSTTTLPNTGYASVHFTINSTTETSSPTITPDLTPQTTPPYTPTPPKTPNTSSPSPSPSPSPTPTTSHYGPYSNVNPASFDLTIYSPDTQTVYADTMLLKFNITWIDFVDFPFPVGPPPKGDYAYSIDDGPRIAIESNQSASDQLYTLPAGNFTINPTFSNLVDISSLENGYHKIVIIVGLYRHSDYYYINQTSVPIMFLVQNPTPSPSPSPSPTIPEFSTWIILSILPITALLAIAIAKRKKPVAKLLSNHHSG